MATSAELLAQALHYHQSGNLSQAEPLYRQVLQADPGHAEAHHLLGVLAHQTGHLEPAISLLRRAIALNPTADGVHSNLGTVLMDKRQFAEAADCFRQAIQLNPANAQAHANLGYLFQKQERFAEAAGCFRLALVINPNLTEAHNTLGVALVGLGQHAEAVECFRQTLRMNPNHVWALSNLGNAHVGQKQFAEAAECFQQALRIEPENSMALWNRAILRLLQGDFAGGWPGYEQRWTQAGTAPRSFQQPRWDGAPLAGKTILVYAEQGYGDTIQFLRYLPKVHGRGGKVLFECQAALFKLLAEVKGVDQLALVGSSLPPFDVQVPLLSLPGIFGTTPATIPTDVPYLHADVGKTEAWRNELSAVKGFKIGIAWQGNPGYPGDGFRSIPLSYFEELARLPDVQIVSLQKGAGIEQLHAASERHDILDLSERLATFSDTAAVMCNLDLVISSCTSIAHLAGALRVPVWTVLSFVPDWRWLLDRSDSPWYPSMRLFRQNRPGDWGEVFGRIVAELRSVIGGAGD